MPHGRVYTCHAAEDQGASDRLFEHLTNHGFDPKPRKDKDSDPSAEDWRRGILPVLLDFYIRPADIDHFLDELR